MTAAQCVLGAILIDGDHVVPVIRGKISGVDFLYDEDRAIYEAACELADNGEPVDPVTILRKTAERGVQVKSEYMRDLMGLTPTAANAEVYSRELVIEASRRKLIEAAETTAGRLSSGEPLHEVCAWLRDTAAEMAERTSFGGLATSMNALLSFNEYRRNLESGKTPATISTGYSKLDELLGGGIVAEGLYILAARPGAGKTTFALNIAERAAAANVPTLFVTLEMSLNQLTAKRLAIETGLSSTWLLNNPDSSSERWQKMHQASIAISERPLIFNRAKSAGVDDVEKLASQTDGLGLVVIDYLGLLRHSEGKSLYEKVTATSGALKRLARTLGAPVLCLAQLNREVEGRTSGEPRISDLRDSGAIEQDADGILLLHRYQTDTKDKAAPAPLKLIVAKNRHGETGSLDMDFYLTNGRIR